VGYRVEESARRDVICTDGFNKAQRYPFNVCLKRLQCRSALFNINRSLSVSAVELGSAT